MDEQIVKEQIVTREDTKELSDEEYSQYVKGKRIN